MKPLIDADLLLHEAGFGVEWKDDEGEKQINSYDSAVDLIDQKVREICEEVWGDEPPTLYLTGGESIRKLLNRRAKKEGREVIPPSPNFREAVAVSKKYKDRDSSKPFHYTNLFLYLIRNYDTNVSWGHEADDQICIDHLNNPDSIICSRDKDLRMCPGRHFGWAIGKQLQFGPKVIDEMGYLELTPKGLSGGGLKFFYAQMLMGDPVDTIPGIPRKGPAFAFKTLDHLETEEELFEATKEVYIQYKGEEDWREYFLEQAYLLWMVREVDQDGNLVMYTPFDERG